ncbi:MAG: lysophospholipid acyltransferase family protein [bacterium]|nr:hypothetical protein [Deltaproteobacteria bacterium]MCP4908471.1 lysophospholipid acyltransferase family protein [bacterium]
MSETDPPQRTRQRPRDTDRRGPIGRLSLWLFGCLTSGLLRALGATWRIEVLGSDPRRADPLEPTHLAALFHESMLPCAWLYRGCGYSVAVSRSRDGDLIEATLRALGYADPARGSSSRGGSAALRGLLRQLGDETTVAVLVDGPRGPARVAKTGIITLARLAERPIQPVAFSARPALRLKSWDRSLIPLPFARVVCAYGQPLRADSETAQDDSGEQALARRLDEVLVALHHEADGRLL